MESKSASMSEEPLDKQDKGDCKTNLQSYRISQMLTQEELASRANVNVRTLQDYEQGRKSINSARADTVLRLAEALGVTVEDILEKN